MGCKSSKSLQVHPHALPDELTPVVPGGASAGTAPLPAAAAAAVPQAAGAPVASAGGATSSSAPVPGGGPPAPLSTEPRGPEPRRPKKTLVKAAKDGNLALMEELSASGSSLEEVGMWDNTPLLAACAYGQSKAALRLIDQGANVFATNEHGATALHYAAVEGAEPIVAALLAGAEGKTNPLVNPGNARVYNRHLDAYAQRTPLASAAESGFATLVGTLLATGAQIEGKNEDEEQTALWLACRHSRLAAVKTLLSNGASVNAKDKKGVSVLGAATVASNEDVVLALLSHGVADVNDTAGMPLRDAVKAGKKGVAEALITHGAAVQPPPETTGVSTPLHAACEKGDEYLVALLIRARAAPSVGDAAGQTAFDLLRRRNLPDSQIATLLAAPRRPAQDGSTGASGGVSRGSTPAEGGAPSRGSTPAPAVSMQDASGPGGAS